MEPTGIEPATPALQRGIFFLTLLFQNHRKDQKSRRFSHTDKAGGYIVSSPIGYRLDNLAMGTGSASGWIHAKAYNNTLPRDGGVSRKAMLILVALALIFAGYVAGILLGILPT